jgi:hypothetical protein
MHHQIHRLTSHRIAEIDRATSSITVNTNDLPNDHQGKKARNGAPPKPTSIHRSQLPRNQQIKNPKTCPICEVIPANQRSSSGRFNRKLIQCDINDCGLWYHDSCILEEKKNEPRKMLLFSANQGINNATFICPKCLDQSEEYMGNSITQAINSILGRVTSFLGGGEAKPLENSQSPVPVGGPPPQSSQQPISQSLEILPWRVGNASTLQRPRNEKYQGFDKSVIGGLVRKLDECIFNYNKEVCDIIEAFGDPEDEALKKPLKTWQLIDARAAIVAGREWYHLSDGSINPMKGHTPMTASLRTMLQIDRDEPLEIAASLGDLNFSQLHHAFISWFVIDILGNRLDIFELPNMKPLRIMMTGVHQFGEESKSISQ